MSEQNVIEKAIEILSNYPGMSYKKLNDGELKIIRSSENGFDIILQLDQIENTLHFGNFHWHFDNNIEESNEMLNQLIFALTGKARLKEFSKNGKAFKWKLEIQDSEGIWIDSMTTSSVNLNFWSKIRIKYLQNHPIGQH